ncbi:MAG: RusA family crossover junction endodeoxyribonuclease [Aquificae bacterium]|nr:RusA family crossover junction endodeoxyribonuclease [Aquificota bacterium]
MRRRKNLVLFLSSLPVPKSNRYLRRRDGRVFKPARVVLWEVRALWELRSQYQGSPLAGPLSVEVHFFFPDNRKRDIDNMLKTLWDVLEKARVIENDEVIHETRTVKVKASPVSGTVVVIKPYRERRNLIEKLLKELERFKLSLSG